MEGLVVVGSAGMVDCDPRASSKQLVAVSRPLLCQKISKANATSCERAVDQGLCVTLGCIIPLNSRHCQDYACMLRPTHNCPSLPVDFHENGRAGKSMPVHTSDRWGGIARRVQVLFKHTSYLGDRAARGKTRHARASCRNMIRASPAKKG